MRLSDFLFPPRCPICDKVLAVDSNHIPHEKCQKKVFPIAEPYCLKCGKPILHSEYEFCSVCATSKHHFTEGRCVFLYENALKHSMYLFKYGGRLEYANWYVSSTVQMYGDWVKKIHPDLILPVPMYYKKRRKRGYNQAEVYGRLLGKVLGIPCIPSLASRVRDTTPQKELSLEQRKKNLRNAFHISENVVEYRRILLVDDIYTTGSTLDSLSVALRELGVKNIFFLCICTGKIF